jgi:hypothetical protein
MKTGLRMVVHTLPARDPDTCEVSRNKACDGASEADRILVELARTFIAQCTVTKPSPEIHARPHTFIGQTLDTARFDVAKYLMLLALPRGLEPLFSP